MEGSGAATPLEIVNVVMVNDSRTPFAFAISTLRLVFGKSEREARELAAHVNWLGRQPCGSYPESVALTLVTEATKLSEVNGHPLRFEIERLVTKADDTAAECSFCGASESSVRKLLPGRNALICDACVLGSARKLAGEASVQRFTHVYELLNWHFAGAPREELVSSNRTFPERMRADLQGAVDELFGAKAVKVCGIHGGHAYDQTSMATLLHEERNAKSVGPLRFHDVDVGDEEPIRCVENALWLLKDGEIPCAVLLMRQQSMHGHHRIDIEITCPSGDAGLSLTERHFRALELAVMKASSYRGKVLSLEVGEMYSGMATGIQVHRLPPVARDEVILPESTLQLLERNVVQFAARRSGLRELGQSGKKGLLFYGPPGTGKTHTVRYLAGALEGHTTLLITAEQVGLLPEYFTLARLLQPSIVVIEDADLIARERHTMQSTCEEVMLNKLLNEMDGLKLDAEVFFILTTNRPESLEAALASRPGRIDQAIEFPLPDADGRRKLVHLYGRGLELDHHIVETIVSRTNGVSAAFIKELMRRSAQCSLERNGRGALSETDAGAALGEMLFSGGKLNRSLLGSTTAVN